MYQGVYNLLIETIFEGVVITGWIELVVTTISTISCLFVFCIPFIVVYKLICLILGR